MLRSAWRDIWNADLYPSSDINDWPSDLSSSFNFSTLRIMSLCWCLFRVLILIRTSNLWESHFWSPLGIISEASLEEPFLKHCWESCVYRWSWVCIDRCFNEKVRIECSMLMLSFYMYDMIVFSHFLFLVFEHIVMNCHFHLLSCIFFVSCIYNFHEARSGIL